MNKDEFKEWRAHHLTGKFFAHLQKHRQELKEQLLTLDGASLEELAMQHLRICTEAKAYEEIISLTEEDMEQ